MEARRVPPATIIAMMLNKIDAGRIRPNTVLLNTALAICGRHGMVRDAGMILHRMIASNVRTDEFSIAAILNAIAVASRRLSHDCAPLAPPAADASAERELPTASAERGSLEASTAKGAPNASTAKGAPNASAAKGSLDASIPSGPPLKESARWRGGQPLALDAFNIASGREGMALAIRLYSSWISQAKVITVTPFNTLLKVVQSTLSAQDLLLDLFPIDRSAARAASAWMPERPDAISYTIAMRAALQLPNPQAFQTVRAYFEAAAAQDPQEGSGAPSVMIDSHAINGALSVFLKESRDARHWPRNLTLSQAREREAFLRSIFEDHLCAGSHRDASLYAIPAETANLALRTALYLRTPHLGIAFWERSLRPFLFHESVRSLRRAAGIFDSQTAVLVAECFMAAAREADGGHRPVDGAAFGASPFAAAAPERGADGGAAQRASAGAVVGLIEEMQAGCGMHMTSDLLECLLRAHRHSGDAVKVVDAIYRYVLHAKTVPLTLPMVHTLLHTLSDCRKQQRAAPAAAPPSSLTGTDGVAAPTVPPAVALANGCRLYAKLAALSPAIVKAAGASPALLALIQTTIGEGRVATREERAEGRHSH